MGNSQGKESQPSSRGHTRRSSAQQPISPTVASPDGPSHQRTGSGIYSSRNGRGSSSFLGLGSSSEPRDPALEPRRETKAEREARKLEKERVLRAQERERSLREEGVDGGYLVTLGVYTGPEDFSKPTVRQLQIERRLAPFWKGLDDHEDTWTEYQILSVVNGRPLPAPDDIPPEEPSRKESHLSISWNPRSSEPNLNNLTVPMGSRSMSQQSDRSSNLSPSHPAFSLPSPTSPIASGTSSSGPFFRGRAKTLASLASGSRNASQTEIGPQELALPADPYVNGQRTEVFLYKDASECPICFMFYPPYLNKTRCCDQPICSECFVQIKRPDPHPPEHHGDAGSPPAEEPQDEVQLVSEPAACPFCVQPEFGVSYEPPPFRRGLVYNHAGKNSLGNAASPMSSTSSLNSPVTSPGRRRATSLAVNDKTVVTTDMVRPDWAKKLADAKAHALRRAAAATALHNAAYMMGNIQQHESRFVIGRRRRNMFGTDSAGSSGAITPRRDGGQSGDGSNDLFPGRGSSRRGNRLDDLEELMMMEAIRLSLAAEEERKRREDKDAAKEAKKDDKKKAKELKKVAKAQSRIGSGFHPIEIEGLDDTGAEGSSVAGKGKEVDRSGGSVGFKPLTEPTSTINASSSKDDPQKHLADSRATIQREASSQGNLAPFDPTSEASHRSTLRNLSNASSSASSFAESYQSAVRGEAQNNRAALSSLDPSPSASNLNVSQSETPEQGTPSTEPMFNFRSLAEAITTEADSKDDGKPQFVEDVAGSNNLSEKHLSASDTTNVAPAASTPTSDSSALEESVITLKPVPSPKPTATTPSDEEIEPAPRIEALPSDDTHLDQKHIGDVSMLGSVQHQATQ